MDYFCSILLTVTSVLLISGCDGSVCKLCTATTNLAECFLNWNCGIGNGCYSRTWLHLGARFYQKGCQTSTIVDCQKNAELFCTLDNSLSCCQSDFCNQADPFVNWRPNVPQGMVVSSFGPTTMTLKWAYQCNNVYTYQVDYYKVGDNMNVQSVTNITGQEVTVPGLESDVSYWFEVRSVHMGRFSASASVQQKTINHTSILACALTTNATVFDLNATSMQACAANEEMCGTTLHYPVDGGSTYAIRSCMTRELCATLESSNKDSCRPGVSGALCHFCCSTFACNIGHGITTDLTCDLETGDSRIECGWEGIDETTCLSRLCCYRPNTSATYDKWCYHKKAILNASGQNQYTSAYVIPTEISRTESIDNGTYAPTSTISPTTTTIDGPLVAGLSSWLIVVIVLAILILIVIIVIVACCVYRRRREKKSGYYDATATYAIPHKRRTRGVIPTISREANESVVTIEELP